jgi:hypothetical protein
LIARTADGLRALLDIVNIHCADLKMTLSVSKSKVLSKGPDVWEIIDDEQVVGCLEKVITFKYLGMNTCLSPSLGAAATRKRAMDLARRYKAGCLRVARDGPDQVEVCLATWLNIAIPSITYGCEVVPLSDSFLGELDRIQSAVAKSTLGLPVCAPNVCTQAVLGIRSVKHTVWAAQLKYFVRLCAQDEQRWSKDAFLDHLTGSWTSPYMKHITVMKRTLGIVAGPRSVRDVFLILNNYFLGVANKKIFELNLPALDPMHKLCRLPGVNESDQSQVVFPSDEVKGCFT